MKRAVWRLSTSAVAFVLIVGLAIGMALSVGYYRIPQNGMYPELPAGSLFFTWKRPYADAASVRPGDIVVFVRELNGQRYNFIWRVIGLPGDRVRTSGESLTINDKPVTHEPLADADGNKIFREEIGEASYRVAFDPSARQPPPDTEVVVPPDHFFVMGDNRFNALDSRRFGPIPFSSIIGKKW